MNDRKPMGKKLRFEVFKRDKFTCQYCGAKAPDAVLHADHLHPVAKGGTNDVLNLVTACEGCNAGKGARLIDDSSVVERQRAQLEILEARREQLQMILEWRDELERVKTDTVAMIAERIGERSQLWPNESGCSDIRKWLKKYSFDEVLSAADEAFEIYMEWKRNKPCKDAWHKAFRKIPAMCSIKRQSAEKPYIQKLCYIQGILRRRLGDQYGKFVNALEGMLVEWGASEAILEECSKRCTDWDNFNRIVAAECGVRLASGEMTDV
jgi:hypothetical protein